MASQYFLISMITSSIIALGTVITVVIQLQKHFIFLSERIVKLSKDEKIVPKELVPKFFLGNLLFYKRLTMKKALRAAKAVAGDIEASKFTPTIIIGIGRGGSIFGSLISYNLYHTPIFSIDREYEWLEKRYDKMLFAFEIPSHLLHKVLLVAGEAHTGGTMDTFVEYLKKIGAGEIQTCVFYEQNSCTYHINYHGTKGDNIILMPWQDSQYIRDSLSKAQADRLKKRQSQRNCPKIVYLVRHAETKENLDGDRFIGSTNATLSEHGRLQAEQVADFIARHGEIDLIYTSPLLRCLETAQTIQQKVHAQLLTKADLREMDYGVWEGLQREEVRIQFPELYRQYEENPFHNYPERGENPIDVQERANRFWMKEILSLPNNINQIVIVTHKTIGRILLNNVIEEKTTSFRERQMENASIAKISIKLGIAEVEYENNILFLK